MTPILTDIHSVPENFWTSLADRSVSLAMAAFVAWLFAKWYIKAMESKDAVQAAKDGLYVKIIEQLTARVEIGETRLNSAEKRIDDCEADRRDLESKLENR